MSRWQRVRSLDVEDWRLLARALIVVATVRLALWVAPFGRVLRMVEALGRGPTSDAPKRTERIVSAVETVSRRVPRATCLTQALATQYLLGRVGIPSVVHFGFARGADRTLAGHAWLESRGRIIVGNGELDRYTELGTAHVKEG